jgi:hypothetical protein
VKNWKALSGDADFRAAFAATEKDDGKLLDKVEASCCKGSLRRRLRQTSTLCLFSGRLSGESLQMRCPGYRVVRGGRVGQWGTVPVSWRTPAWFNSGLTLPEVKAWKWALYITHEILIKLNFSRRIALRPWELWRRTTLSSCFS